MLTELRLMLCDPRFWVIAIGIFSAYAYGVKDGMKRGKDHADTI